MASFHSYDFAGCNTEACWNAEMAPVAASYPVVTGELGENDCATGFIDSYMAWADAPGVSYLGWTWDTLELRLGPGPDLVVRRYAHRLWGGAADAPGCVGRGGTGAVHLAHRR